MGGEGKWRRRLRAFFSSLSSSSVAGVPLFDPLGAVEVTVASRGLLAASALTGALLSSWYYGLVRGRAFCGWVCPVNLIGEGWMRLVGGSALIARAHGAAAREDRCGGGGGAAVGSRGLPVFELSRPLAR